MRMEFGLVCTGLYKNGTSTIGYHIMSADGSHGGFVSKDQTIMMIQRGQVDNLRVRTEEGIVEVRGKGVNLLSLPTYNVRGDQKTVENKKKDTINNRYTIKKRICYKDSCVGYVLELHGNNLNISKKKIIDLIQSGKIANANIVKVIGNNGEPTLQIVGVGYDIKKLPSIYIDSNGNTVSGSSVKSDESILARAYIAKRPGIIHYQNDKRSSTFDRSDYLVCMPNGMLAVIKHSDALKRMRKSSESYAPCDANLGNLKECPIEFIGIKQYAYVNGNTAIGWPIVSITG